MAQRVLGVDLGAHTIKVAELDVGFRTVQLRNLRTSSVVWQPGGPLASSLASLPEGLRVEEHDTVSIALPGDHVLLRVLNVPFSDPRKLQAVVGNELADDMPWEFEDVVYDHVMTSQPGKVLAAAARSADVSMLLEALASQQIVPRQIAAAPLAYGGIVRRLHPEEVVLLLDIGHLRTNICLLEAGRPVLGRTISRAGAQLTEALRETFQLPYPEAEQLKHGRAFLAPEGAQLDPMGRRLAEVTALAMAPLVREVRRTIALASGHTGVEAERVVLCGGTSLLTGIEAHFERELGLPTAKLELGSDEGLGGGLAAEGQALGALSLSLALDAGRRESLDFRQGAFAFRTDRSVFRDKVVSLATAAVLVLIFAAVSAYSSLHALRREEKTLEKELRTVSRRVLGQAITDPWKASKTVKGGARAKSAGIPTMTALDMLDLVSRQVPDKAEIKLDVNRIDIKPGKIYLKGTADSLSAVGNIVKALKKVSCFKDVASGKISGVSGERKQFSLTITSKCF